MIPLFKPSITEEEISAVIEVLNSGWLGLGPKTEQFEKNFSEYVGSNFAVGLNSGTAALHLALNVIGLEEADEVIVPTITFISTAHAVSYQRAIPVFTDVNEDTLCIDIDDLQNKITSKTKAIIPVHYAGHPCDLDEIKNIAKQRNLKVIEDAAHACGAEYKQKKIGSISDLTCFSFHAVKNLTCGEGGMITTNDENYATILKELYWLGINKTTYVRTENDKIYAWQYWVNRLGFKAHLNDIASAIGIVQLKKLDALNKKRKYFVSKYNEELEKLTYLEIPHERDYVKSSWHIYHIKLEKRDQLLTFLKERGITPGIHYYPNHLHPYYRSSASKCPVAERVWKKILSLPLFPDMTDQMIDTIIHALREFDVVCRAKSQRIIGESLNLREIDSTDLSKMLIWRNNEENRKWFFTQDEITNAQQEEWYNLYLEDKTDFMYIIETKEGVPIGTIGIKNIDKRNKQAEIGRLIIGEKDYLRKGFATEATKILVNYCFEKLNLNRIYLEVFKHNIKAINMYKQVGFRKEGSLREAIFAGGTWHDIDLMSILKNEFKRIL
jgi:perosamine synthetase